MTGLETLLAKHPFFAGMDEPYLNLVAGCARNVRFEAGHYLFHQGEPANRFYIVREGRVSLEVHAPGRGTATIRSVNQGDALGFSWLMPPYQWTADARAVESTRAIQFDGACLRRKCDADPRLGYDLMKRLARVCGPEIMMRLSAEALAGRGVPAPKIYLSLERNMKCAVGQCGRCQLGSVFICREGPVFPLPAIQSLMRVPEL